MNAAAVRMTFEDWGEVLRIAATIWPQSRSFFDDRPGAERTPTRTWWAALCRFGTDDVLTAIGRLGMTSRYWPSLADVVETTREVLAERLEQRRRAEELARARLHAPRQSTAPDRLAVFDQTTAAVRRERSQELRRFVAHAGGVDVGPDPLADASDGVGEWERRVRELIARGWPEADGVNADPDSASGKRDDPAAAVQSAAAARSAPMRRATSLVRLLASARPDMDQSMDDRRVWAPPTSHSRPGRAADAPRGAGRWRDAEAETADGAADPLHADSRSPAAPRSPRQGG